MKKEKNSTGVIAGILLPIGLVCLFAFCSLALALLGGNAYKMIQGGIEDSYGSTVCSSYLQTKLSQNNASDSITLRDENGTQVLVITSRIEDRDVETWIFYNNGELKENLVSAGTPFRVEGGMKVASVNRCEFSLSEDGLFTAEVESPSGEVTQTVFALAKGGAG